MIKPPLFITWQPVLTDHQAFTYEALSQKAQTPLLAYVLTMEDATRRSQGWQDTQVKSIERRLIPERGGILYCYRKMREHRKDVHLFGSAFQNLKMLYCLFLAVLLRVEFYIVSEPYSPIAQGYFSDKLRARERLKAALRPFLYRVYMSLLKYPMSGVFAISSKALEQYSTSGVAPTKLFPFGYFVPNTEPHIPSSKNRNTSTEALKIVFVGALIERKGIDLIVDAVAHSTAPVSLDIYGPGDPAQFAIDNERISLRGTIPFGMTQKVVSSYDVLVLPSRYDGWGVVVNEALCAGVPVICSDQVGARVLVERFGAGEVFDSNNPHALASIINTLCSDPMRLLTMRAATQEAAVAIQPDVAAAYMLAVLRAAPQNKAAIASPWYPEKPLP
jgi:glycosyltransferase involved in cell wall biosynthesis